MPVIRVGVQAPQGSEGQVVDLDGPRASIASIANVSAVSIAYSLDGGSSWTTLAAGASGGAGVIDAGMLRLRKVASTGAYPATVDVDATTYGLADASFTPAQTAALQGVVSGGGDGLRAGAVQPLRDAGVRAADSATLTAQNAWLGGNGFTHIHAFCSINSQTWAENSAYTDTIIARFAGESRETKWAFPLCTNSQPIDETIAGTHDSVILEIARKIVAGAPAGARYIDIRPGWEPNFSTSFPWGATLVTTAQYIAAFRRVTTLLRSVDARVRIAFCPAYRVDAGYPWLPMYPGDEYVDLIAPDVYCLDIDQAPLGVSTNTDHAEAMFSGVCGVNVFRDFAVARGKRFALAEWGVNYDNPIFVERMADFIRTNDVEYHGYWDQNNAFFTCKLSGDQWPNSALAFVRAFGSLVIDTWGVSALPGQRLRAPILANRPLLRLEITAGNTGGLSVDGVNIVAEPQVSGTRRITVKAYDFRGQHVSRSIVLTWQAGRLWSPADLGASLVDWYSLDFHGTVARHINAIKGLTSISSSARTAAPASASLRPTYGINSVGVPRAAFDGDAAIQTDLTGTPGSQSAVTYAMQLYTDPAASNFTYVLSESDAGASVRAIGYNAGNLRVGSAGGYAGPAISGGDNSVVVSFGVGATAPCRGGVNGGTPTANTVAMPVATFTRRVIGGNAGAGNAVGSYYLGVLSELFIANVAFNAAQEDLAHGYLAWKYGKESALPGGHVYKNSPPMAT